MPKARMSALDVRAMVTDIMPLCLRLRVANIYDISSRIYVLKLSEGEVKQHLVLQCGTRFHLSRWKRDKQAIPSVFTMRLRNYLRTKRLTALEQLGYDRVIDLTFGNGEHAFHLIVELYAKGNLVLTDHQYIVKSSWRQFKSDDYFAVRLGAKYPIEEYCRESRFVSPSLSTYVDKDMHSLMMALRGVLEEEKIALENSLQQPTLKGRERKDKQNSLDTNSVPFVNIIMKLFPVAHRNLVEHVLIESDISQDCCISLDVNAISDEIVNNVMHTINELLKIWNSLTLPGLFGSMQQQKVSPNGSGDIYTSMLNVEDEPHSLPEGKSEVPIIRGYLQRVQVNETSVAYEDFSPIPILKKEWLTFEHFHECVDEFYSSLEVHKAEKVKNEKLTELESKIDNIRQDQIERVERLEGERSSSEKQAICVEYHLDFVGTALEMMQRIVQSGSDWMLIEKIIKEQRRNNHPICSYIQSLDLANGKFVLLLPDTHFGHTEDEREIVEDLPLVPVTLIIAESAFQNVKNLHDLKKQAQVKYWKTKSAAQRVIMKAEQAAEKVKKSTELATELRPAIRKIRKRFWFESFYWFISSDGYLVLGGHDAIENEILYKKYLRNEDLFVHADVHGAATCIIRNGGERPIPKATIDEAGAFAVCRSSAWKQKVLVTAYWVYAHQVSKTPQPGEYVSTGGFIIRGQRNPIAVKKLEMGLAILFHLGDEETIRRHQQLTKEDTDENCKENPSEEKISLERDSFPSSCEESSPKLSASHSSKYMPGVERSPSPTMHISSVDEASEVGSEDLLTPEQKMEAKTLIMRPLSTDLICNARKRRFSSRVQFGASEILPTPTIAAKVVFDELPPEVIVVHSERSILSDDENHLLLRSEFSLDNEGNDVETLQMLRLAANGQRRLSDLRRPDSADELPPPATYADRAAPRDLLARRTPETAPQEAEESSPTQARNLEKEVPFDRNVRGAQTDRSTAHRHSALINMPGRETVPLQSRSAPLRRRSSRAVDGGPLPRGFLEVEMPSVRTLLRRHSSQPLTSFPQSTEKQNVDADSGALDAKTLSSGSSESEVEEKSLEKASNHIKAYSISTHSPSSMQQRPPKRMSRAERRTHRRGAQAPEKEIGSEPMSATTKKSTDKPLPRGKRSKWRKMKDKYRDQSDDERDFAMKVLGTQRMKLNVEPSSEKIVTPETNECTIPSTHKYEPAPDRIIAEEVDDEEDREQWRKKLDVLNELSGRPVENDTLLAALPMCAPPGALRNHSYKGKLLPGGVKKGQAAKNVLQAFIQMAPDHSVERELIKQIPLDELLACMVTNPIVQIQGIDRLIKAEKKTKKLEKSLKQNSKK